MTFLYRLMGAAMLDAGTYEAIEADRRAPRQAFLVVMLASASAGLGARLDVWGGVEGFVRMALFSLLAWLAWATLALQIGTRVLPQPQTRSDTSEMLRTLGFAATPGMLQVFALIPGVRTPVFVLTFVWMFAAMVVALRHALDYTSPWRALAVCAIAAAVTFAFAFGLSVMFSSAVS
jgi:hypothetical protein